MKRGDSEMPNDKSPKRTKAEPSDEGLPATESTENTRSGTSNVTPSGPSQDTSRDTPHRVSAGPSGTVTTTLFTHAMDPAAEKLAPSSTMDLALLQYPFLQVPAPPPCPRPRSRVSREEFRRRLIWTIEEALRIVEDDSEPEIPNGKACREN